LRQPCPIGGSIAHAIPLYYMKSRFRYYNIIATGASKAAVQSRGSVGVF